MSSSDSVSIKELASKLKTSDALIKKIIKDFEIETIRNQKRVLLSPESVQTIRDILALRASGKKNIEIKQLFDESQTSKKQDTKETNVVQDSQPIEEPSEEAVLKKPKKLKQQKPIKPEQEISQESRPEQPPELNLEDKSKEQSALELEGLSADDILELSVQNDLADVDVLVPGDYLEDELSQSSTQDELKELLSLEGSDDLDEEIEEEITDDEIEEELTQNRSRDRLSPRKIRRRQFSFRYIQRQIANDSKRVNYIKQKLRRGSLSTKEKMNLEDSLHHRSVLLSGWIQLLRWVKS